MCEIEKPEEPFEDLPIARSLPIVYLRYWQVSRGECQGEDAGAGTQRYNDL